MIQIIFQWKYSFEAIDLMVEYGKSHKEICLIFEVATNLYILNIFLT